MTAALPPAVPWRARKYHELATFIGSMALMRRVPGALGVQAMLPPGGALGAASGLPQQPRLTRCLCWDRCPERPVCRPRCRRRRRGCRRRCRRSRRPGSRPAGSPLRRAAPARPPTRRPRPGGACPATSRQVTAWLQACLGLPSLLQRTLKLPQLQSWVCWLVLHSHIQRVHPHRSWRRPTGGHCHLFCFSPRSLAQVLLGARRCMTLRTTATCASIWLRA